MGISSNKKNIFAKARYIKPEILKVDMDSDISLQLASDQPPVFDNENISSVNNNLKQNPFIQS